MHQGDESVHVYNNSTGFGVVDKNVVRGRFARESEHQGGRSRARPVVPSPASRYSSSTTAT
ncbi:unnamed protein product, partial [Amoebophrya sp. A25]|eukprot:GSA25T00011239001.1